MPTGPPPTIRTGVFGMDFMVVERNLVLRRHAPFLDEVLLTPWDRLEFRQILRLLSSTEPAFGFREPVFFEIVARPATIDNHEIVIWFKHQ